ncbi:sulfate reduction electron transfer complex DsrMKJOP subunit DsrK [Desulfopila aestuarii]|uniref:Putative sulfite reductase-associated electron transfer protein DsrK n=1 Tax=Desulfopila aestuarii DSM 18488 TaxID=1121416 RepID=A0A1M7YAP7_9BACT|nr:(Fe-S)-binding protein [Desulfopila aestuarii]SHO49705.1 putative sulfite reductase-associated electron transfer protein DsrK [Desulfopila aestuarii DSM 18488]
MSVPKLEQLSKSVAQGPSLATGAVPTQDWMDIPAVFKSGNYAYPAKKDKVEYLNSQKGLYFPNAREWSPEDDDWKLPEDWKNIILNGLKERLDKFRSLKIFMDCCVRCGACADKCHFFLGTGDPKNMPVLRAELLRSVYRNDFTLGGKILGKMAGGREMTVGVLKEWFMYSYQCTECRRCSVFCPYGIDTAEITMMLRELLHLVGVGINWILEPASNSNRTGNHMGLQPHTFKDNVEFLVDDVENLTGVRPNISFNRKGAEILFITPSADVFAEPGLYTAMGYMILFEAIGLDYTWSTYASEGGNFGLFTNNETMKKLNAKMYAEAERLGVKYIIGGECGHMWRVLHQYMDTMNGPADFLEVPVSPITGTKFQNAASTKMVHITEFTADLIKHGKLKLDKSRNSHVKATFHDSCNTSRAMGLLDEPRYVLDHVVDNWVEMPENTIREQTFCCGSGTGLNTDEIMELRMRSGYPRANAVQYVRDKFDVNTLACVCAIDRATLTSLNNYWTPEVTVCGLTELVGNAIVQENEGENRAVLDEGLRTMV